MNAYRGPVRELAAVALRAVLAALVLVWFWRALVSLAAVVAVVLAGAAAIGAAALAVARWWLLRRRGW